MVDIRHLSNAPIAEALIDLRVQLPVDFDIKSFEVLKNKLNKEYPYVEEQRSFQGKLGLESGKPISEIFDRGHIGYIFKSNDELNIAQFRIDGFTFNRLKPYTTWEDIHDKTEQLWNDYISIGILTTVFM